MNINKKQHSKTFKTIIKIGAAVVLVAGSSGLVFGLTASLSLNEKYVDIKPYQFNEGDKINPRIAADYSSLPSVSYWNCSSTEPINERNNVYKYSTIDEYPNGSLGNYPLDVLSNSPEEMYSCASQILDGATHVTLDKSFNESSYLGLVNWIHQKDNTIKGDPWKAGDAVRLKNSELKNADSNGYKDGQYSARSSKPSSDDSSGFHSIYMEEINKMPLNSDDPDGSRKGSLLLPGYIHEDPLKSFKEKQTKLYNEATYTILDGGFDSDRCASVYYRADQSAFLCGIAICQYLQDRYDSIYSKINHGKLAVGTFGGLPIPTVTSFMGGFEWGIYIYNKCFLPKYEGYDQWDDATKAKRKVDLICVGRSESFYSNSFVTGEAKLLVQQLLTQGADAILPVAGPQTIDVVNEIRNRHSPAVVIGVDTDQENSDIGEYRSKSSLNKDDKIIQFSAKKDLAGISSTILQARAKGVRGYYFDEDFNVNYLGYDGKKLDQQEDYTRYSFIGNSGYATVGTIYNKGAGISQGADNTLNYESANELNGGTGWQSLLHALKLVDVEEDIDDSATYNDLISFLLWKRFDDIDDQHKDVNVFEFLEDNEYFVYK